MTKTFFADRAALLSPRTAEYVEAMIREGDSFDYSKWLKRVRQEAAQAKQDQTAIISRDIVAVRETIQSMRRIFGMQGQGWARH
jgi:hypothetical protein